ncbi:hypothetical protein ACTJK3_24885 [Pseudomonas sp. 22105]|uniref:hypothetical protein n=1 Tax=unclassified Pseudomonas TaxID=196821 RepID=UPI003F84E447
MVQVAAAPCTQCGTRVTGTNQKEIPGRSKIKNSAQSVFFSKATSKTGGAVLPGSLASHDRAK